MTECIFTIDYEIYGNGQGDLRELVFEPALKLAEIFQQARARLVVFVEAAELEMIEAAEADPAIGLVQDQIRRFRAEGHEIGLHLHPQWYNARRENGSWALDESEYNLCTLRRERMEWMLRKAIAYLRRILSEPGFTPLSFRAGNWLLQPSATAAAVLAGEGIRVDSSVFKGGRQRPRGLDYRPSLRNGYYWKFQDDVNVHDPAGQLLEIPTYTRQVPFWRMLTSKRLALQDKGSNHARKSAPPTLWQWARRLGDRLRLRYPLKFDFCRMTFDELRASVETAIQDDRHSPALLKPLVAIGHTKDLDDFETVTRFLAYLRDRGIRVSTFEDVYPRCRAAGTAP
jgi:hypothetical protein